MSKLIDHDTGDWLDRWIDSFGIVYSIKPSVVEDDQLERDTADGHDEQPQEERPDEAFA
jgi:hypothetical protein